MLKIRSFQVIMDQKKTKCREDQDGWKNNARPQREADRRSRRSRSLDKIDRKRRNRRSRIPLRIGKEKEAARPKIDHMKWNRWMEPTPSKVNTTPMEISPIAIVEEQKYQLQKNKSGKQKRSRAEKSPESSSSDDEIKQRRLDLLRRPVKKPEKQIRDLVTLGEWSQIPRAVPIQKVQEILQHHRQDRLREPKLDWLRCAVVFNEADTYAVYLVSEDFIRESYLTPLRDLDQWKIKIYRADCYCQLLVSGRGPLASRPEKIEIVNPVEHTDRCPRLPETSEALVLQQRDAWCVYIRYQKCKCTRIVAGMGSWIYMTQAFIYQGFLCIC